MCPNSDAATAIDAYGVRGCYADVAELGQASRAFEAVAGEDRGNIVRDHCHATRERLADLGRLWLRTVNLDHLQILLFKKLRQGFGVLVHGCQIDNP